MPPTHKIAVVQLHPEPLQVEQNFNRAASYIRSAATQGAELVVLPEYHLTNWVPKLEGFLEACDPWETYLKKYQALAKECSICIVPGTIIERHRDAEKEEDKLLNVAYFVGNDGEILGRYVKKNLWGNIERDHLTSSSRDPHEVFDTPVGKVGILICWDIAFPEAFRELISQGAQLIVCPTFWTLMDCSKLGLEINPTAETLFLDSILTARCFENTCAIAFANAGGPPGKGYAGISQKSMPYAGAVAKLGGCGEGMAVAEVDYAVLEDAEQNYQVRADLARADWHYDYRHGNVEDDKAKL